MQTLLSFGALAFAISATTNFAAAQCWCSNGPAAGYVVAPYVGYIVVHRASHHPMRHATENPQIEKRRRPAPAHPIAKRPKQPQREEKAPPAGPPPTLPPQ